MENISDKFMKDFQESLAEAKKMMELAQKIESLPAEAVEEKAVLQEELTALNQKQTEKAIKNIEAMNTAMSSIFGMFEVDNRSCEAEVQGVKKVINELTEKQAKAALLALAGGGEKTLIQAVMIGKNSPAD